MLEKAIEIEGLLRIIRDGDPLPETYILLNIKAAELAEQAVCLEERSGTPEPAPEQADFVMASPEAPAHSMPEVTFTVQAPHIREDQLVAATEDTPDFAEDDSETAAEDLSLIEEDDILLSFDDTGDFTISTMQEEATDPSEDMTPDLMPETVRERAEKEDETEETEDENNETEEPGKIEEATTKEPETTIFNKEPQPETAETKETMETDAEDAQPVDTAKPLQKQKREIRLKAAFSLNDRYLYARELFDGNMKMLDSTLEFIEGIEDYSIIEDYFYSELEWDPENSHVAAFMDILRPHFKE